MRIGLGELLVIAVLFLILFGPDKFSQTARKAGEAFRTYRQAHDTIQRAKNPLNWAKIIEVKPVDAPPKKEPPKNPT